MMQLSLLPEPTAVVSRRPQEPIMRDAMVKDGCRLWLKRAWGAGPCILWAMCNPSDADARRDDPTMLRVMEFSNRWGYGSCIVINPVPVISPTPDVALAWVDAVARMDHSYQDKTWCEWNANIDTCLQQIIAAEAHIAAWGNLLPQDFVNGWLQSIADADARCPTDDDPPPIEWLCLGTNANGTPRHPLSRGKCRVPSDFKPVPWKRCRA